MNVSKIKVFTLTDHRTLSVGIDGQNIGGVGKFVYLRSVKFAFTNIKLKLFWIIFTAVVAK